MRKYVFECSRGAGYVSRVFVVSAYSEEEARGAAIVRARHWWHSWNGLITATLMFDWPEPYSGEKEERSHPRDG